MITLRPYQSEDIDKIMDCLAGGYHPVCAVATGGGKSVYIAELCKRLDGRILVVTHRKELISQNEAGFIRHGGEDVGVYSAGLNRRDMEARVVFAGVASIHRRMDQLQEAGEFWYVIWDEAHTNLTRPSEPSMGTTIMKACPIAQRIGMSATPYRLDSGAIYGGDDSWFDVLACERGITELTELGYLAPLSGVQTASDPDVSGVHTRGGDFILSELSRAFSEEDVVSLACDEITSLAWDRQSILAFCVDKAHASLVSMELATRGIQNQIVVEDTKAKDRFEILEDFKVRKLRCIVNVGVLTTGFDAPVVDCVAILRATQSKALFVQMMGRGCRLHESKEDCLVLDLGGNLRRHQPVDGIPEYWRSPRLVEQEEDERRPIDGGVEKDEEERKARHGFVAERFLDPLAGNIADGEARWLRVVEVSYSLKPASKYPDRTNLLVHYNCEGRRLTRFLLPDYGASRRREVEAWFRARGFQMPREHKQMLAVAYQSRIPKQILVQKDGTWDRVLQEEF